MSGTEVALIAICASLFSILITVIIFVFGFRDRLTRVEESVKGIYSSLQDLKTLFDSRPVCDLHAAIDKAAAVREERLTQLEVSIQEMKDR